MLSTFQKTATALTFAAAFLAPTAHATPVISNTVDPLAVAAPFNHNLRTTSFTTASAGGDYLLSDVQVKLDSAPSTSPSTLFASIYSDASNLPGTPLESLSVGTFDTGTNLLTFNSGAFTLTAGSTYWVVMGDNSSTQNLYWYGTTSSAVVGLAGWNINRRAGFSFNSGSSWTMANSVALYLAVNATPVTTVPEPGSFALLVAGLAGLIGFRRRQAG